MKKRIKNLRILSLIIWAITISFVFVLYDWALLVIILFAQWANNLEKKAQQYEDQLF